HMQTRNINGDTHWSQDPAANPPRPGHVGGPGCVYRPVHGLPAQSGGCRAQSTDGVAGPEAGARPTRADHAARNRRTRARACAHGTTLKAAVSEATRRGTVHLGTWQWPCDGRGVANRLGMAAAGPGGSARAYEA